MSTLLRVELISSRKVLLFDKSRTFSLNSTLCFNRLFNHVWDKPLWVSIHEIQTSLSYVICQAVPKKYENIQKFWRRLKAKQYSVYESHINGMEIIMSKEMGKSWVGLETLHIISLFLTQNYFLYQSMPLEISFVIFLQFI